DLDRAQTIIESIATGCEYAGCALIGGETAEMPGVYHGEDFDLAGFCVGVAEKSQLLTYKTPEAGDALLALPASGPHSNGFSLIRRLLTERTENPRAFLDGKPIIEHLLTPTQIYAKPVLSVLKAIDVRGIAHITGGGLTENIPRMLPPDLIAWIDESTWQWPAIFEWLKNQSGN
ncbi:MAG: phosphoribosylformylglycinamidine cyclo-ligase, partial [Gammaproteobacteria bacterium]